MLIFVTGTDNKQDFKDVQSTNAQQKGETVRPFFFFFLFNTDSQLR